MTVFALLLVFPSSFQFFGFAQFHHMVLIQTKQIKKNQGGVSSVINQEGVSSVILGRGIECYWGEGI